MAEKAAKKDPNTQQLFSIISIFWAPNSLFGRKGGDRLYGEEHSTAHINTFGHLRYRRSIKA